VSTTILRWHSYAYVYLDPLTGRWGDLPLVDCRPENRLFRKHKRTPRSYPPRSGSEEDRVSFPGVRGASGPTSAIQNVAFVAGGSCRLLPCNRILILCGSLPPTRPESYRQPRN